MASFSSKEGLSQTVMKRDQRQSIVTYVRQECLKHHNPKCLNDMLDSHLDPTKSIDDYDSIQWLKWLMAGGPQFEVFGKKVREYDSSVMCGLVWTTNFVAYRCRTCAISPCMSLCADCFMAGNHEGHDYNMFRSQAGGACDCGDTNVMHASGFCPRHGPANQQSAASPPVELLSVSQAMMPRIFARLIFYLRDTSDPGSTSYSMNLTEAEQFIAFLQSLSDMGAAMRRIMTLALVDPAHYQAMVHKGDAYYEKSAVNFAFAFASLEPPTPNLSTPRAAGFYSPDEYKTMLDELVFWLCKCEYPQSLVTLLLGLLPDDIYKNEFTVAFVRHYSKIVHVLTVASDRSTVANRVVHISVQLFSNETLATRMVKEQQLLRSVVQSLTSMFSPIMVPSTNLGGPSNRHQVVECEKAMMKEHCYWPVVSDLINLLSHRAVSHSFLQQPSLRAMWMDLLTSLQGMNLNVRELTHHVEYEPDTYYAAFSAELEISASPMWSLISHCTDRGSKQYVTDTIKAILQALDKWFSAIDFRPGSKPHDNQLTFHLPLHRYLAAFLMLAVTSHHINLQDLLPSLDILVQILIHPLHIQVCVPQIYAGLWVRNGIQIKGQAMTYIQCHFCYSMSDLDIFLLQVCAASMQPDQFVELVIDRFRIQQWLCFEYDHKASEAESGGTPPDITMLDGCLTFLCTLIGLRTYVGIGEEELVRKEMASLLCMSDRQHSQLSELMPERSGMSGRSKELFEPTLKKLADYKAPNFEAGSGLNQGCYTPKGSVWEEDFDPVMVAQRAIYKKDFQAAMDRYTAYMRSIGAYKGKNSPWPPYKIPEKVHVAYSKLYGILNCATMHAFLYTILFKTLHEVPTMPDCVLYKTIHLLSLCLHFAPKTFPSVTPCVSGLVKDGDLRNWFRTTDVKANACEVIHRVELFPKEGETAGHVGHMDLTNSSLEEMFSIQPSMLAAPNGPITAAQTGQFPSVSMPSGSFTISSSSPQPVTATPDVVKPKYHSCGVSTGQPPGCQKKELGESIISLLIKLHDKLSFPPAIYKQGATIAAASKSGAKEVGDGTFYIAQFLDRLSSSSTTAGKYVQSTCKILHSRATDTKAEDPEESDIKRKKAYDRQQRLMAKFASRQMAFMAQAQGTDDVPDEEMTDTEEAAGATASASGQKYDCVICNQCTPSKTSKLMGLVVFLQSSSVLGHRQHTEVVESVLSPPSQEQVSQGRCGGIQRQRQADMLKCFDEESSDMSVSIGWDGGVYASTCGHHLHLDCHSSYIETLKRNQNQTENIAFSRGEFYCPMCRQISNAMLPVIPQDEEQKPPLARPPNCDPSVIVRDIGNIISQKNKQTVSTELKYAVMKTMEAVYNITYEPFHILPHHSASNPFLFISSVVRTNLELEILFRGGNLQQPLPASTSKKLCLSPLMTILSLHCGNMSAQSLVDYSEMWEQQWVHLTGVPLTSEPSTKLTQYRHRVPLLLRDMAAQLCQLVLLLPPSAQQLDHFLCMVRMLFNATYMQALTVLSCRLTQAERQAWWQKGSEATASSLQRWLNFIIGQLKTSFLYKEMDASDDFLAICQSVWSPLSVEAWTEDFCLPFLRVAALLRQAMFGPTLEDVQTDQSEFTSLVHYLDLHSGEPVGEGEVMGIACMKWAVGDPFTLVRAWCHDLTLFASSKTNKCKMLMNIDEKWALPSLLSLPERYYDIFTTFRHQACTTCRRVPKDPTICLICGAFLCFREQCCADVNTVFECVAHSVSCGGGTGIFLLVNSSIIVVLRGQRATLWGSVYLDQHGEEDRDLKRGKPLYLSRERLQLLESQWVNHNFEQSCKRWIWHRDHL